MTRNSSLLVVAALATSGMLALSSCSSTGSGSGDGGATGGGGSCKTASKKLNVAFVYATTLENPMQEMALGAKAAADEDGNVHLTESAPPQVDGPGEVSMLQAAIRNSTDGIAWESVTPDLFTRPLKQAIDAGIPVVAVDNTAPKGADVKTFVGNSNTLLGQKLGEAFVAERPDPHGEVVLGNDIPSLPLLGQRMDGVESVIKSELPGMKVDGPFDAKGQEPTTNLNTWKSLVNSHPNATAFIGVGGPDGISLPLIKQQTGKTFLAGSADVPPQALHGVKSGALFALSSPEHWMKGYIAMHLLIHAKRTCGKIPEGWWNSGSLLIDKSNIDSILARQKSPAARMQWFKPVADKQLASPPIKPIDQAN